MASLKDMRVRIASTKATQKITKAMQMVAASKLRRAQAAAEAARPFAERMEKVLAKDFTAKAVEKIVLPAQGLNSDLHAAADYRAHLVTVMAQRAVEAAAKV